MAASLRDGIAAGASRSRQATLVVALSTSIVVCACACQPAHDGAAASAARGEKTAVADAAEGDAMPAQPVVAPASVPPDLLTAALEDAAKRTGAKVADIEVTVAEAVTWPDGSMGCPQPGMMYTQALVPGYRIVLRAGKQILNYHAGARGGPNFCPADRVASPAPGRREEAM
ncbi:MAG TPA: hypothetical protein VFI92_00760 [Steroidobacteraceae bacterium]|nr:hypothetical protein [Steroidobacteraceae bacterium]